MASEARLPVGPAKGEHSPERSETGLRAGRINSIDTIRGLVMVLMALDHTREYFHLAPAGLDATDPLRSTLLLYATRWITYLCAPTFVLLTGLSAWLRGDRAGKGGLPRFLALRGLWLIFLEFALIGPGFSFHPGYLFLQIIWVIGAGCLLLSILCRLPSWVSLAAGLGIIALRNLLDPWMAQTTSLPLKLINGSFALIDLGPVHGVLLYSLLGWLGILLAGYGMGPLMRADADRRRKVLSLAGAAMVAAFALLRFANVYGDPLPWHQLGSAQATALSFMRVSKYPPSLDYDLVTLGPMLILLAWLEDVRSLPARVLTTYGRVPFFFYVLHIYLIHGSAAVAGMLSGLPFASFTDPLNPPQGFGVSLGFVYLLWLSFVALLYLPCRWFERLRARRSDWWLSYL